MFKQLLQAGAIDFCQIDACRLGGVNEVLAVLLMAKKYRTLSFPSAEMTSHLPLLLLGSGSPSFLIAAGSV